VRLFRCKNMCSGKSTLWNKSNENGNTSVQILRNDLVKYVKPVRGAVKVYLIRGAWYCPMTIDTKTWERNFEECKNL